ncbi:hypothetical protein PVAG01_10618 [Phlyctema vagabunda]|uniref:Uncharacterized protein n=1 Tax=Phlyctema vagabunda TaxID=108571 RepID=A0ABR4P2S9_9HELO
MVFLLGASAAAGGMRKLHTKHQQKRKSSRSSSSSAITSLVASSTRTFIISPAEPERPCSAPAPPYREETEHQQPPVYESRDGHDEPDSTEHDLMPEPLFSRIGEEGDDGPPPPIPPKSRARMARARSDGSA